MRIRTTFMMVFIALITASFFFGCSGADKNDSHVIGVIVPLSGGGATLGQPLVNGMNLAVEEINSEGGINGAKIRLAVQDSKLDGKVSVDAVSYLENFENPEAYIVLFHLPAQAISPILKDAKKPLVYEAFTRSILADNPYSFKANFDSLAGCEKLIRFAKENRRYKKLGAIMSMVEYNDLCLEGIRKADPSVVEYRYAFGDKDFRTLFSKAKEDGVDALMTIGIDFEYLNMFKQLSESGYPIKMMCATASECIFPEVVFSSSNETLKGTLSIDFVPPDIMKTGFGEKYSSRYPNPSFTDYVYGSVGYEEVQYLSEAMKGCEVGDSECLFNALKEVKNYSSVLGSKGFKDRVLDLDMRIYEYDGAWQAIG